MVEHQCQICHKAFGTKGNARRHVESVHKNKRYAQCPICAKAFGSKKCLTGHIKSVHGDQNTSSIP